jgi:hypothetical protein
MTFIFQYNFSDPSKNTKAIRSYAQNGITINAPGNLRIYTNDYRSNASGIYKLINPGTAHSILEYRPRSEFKIEKDFDQTYYLNFSIVGIHETDATIPVSVSVSGVSSPGGGKMSDSIDIDVGRLSLVIDGDNNNGPAKQSVDPVPFDLPEDSLEEDLAKHYLPGKIVPVNDIDTDNDGVPDFAEGFDYSVNGASQAAANASQCFAPFTLKVRGSIPAFILAKTPVFLDYPSTKPTAINGDNDHPEPGLAFNGDVLNQHWGTFGGNLRIWRKDGNQVRSVADDFIQTASHTFEYFGITGRKREATFFIECTEGQKTFGGVPFFLHTGDEIGKRYDNVSLSFESTSGTVHDGFHVTGFAGHAFNDSLSTFSFGSGELFGGGLTFQTFQYAEEFVKDWTIDWSKCEPTVFLLSVQDPAHLTNFKRAQTTADGTYKYQLDGSLSTFGGYVAATAEPENQKPKTVMYGVNAPSLKGMTANPVYWGVISVQRTLVRVTPFHDGSNYSSLNGLYPDPPYGNHTILGGFATVDITTTENLRDKAKYVFDAPKQGQFIPVHRSSNGANGVAQVLNWNGNNSFFLTASRPGVDVFEVDGLIDGKPVPLLRIPVEAQIVNLLEPDPPQLPVALRNTKHYRDWLTPAWPQLDEEDTPVPGDIAYHLPGEGNPDFTVMAKNLDARSRKSIFMAGQMVPWLAEGKGLGWNAPFLLGDGAVGFASSSNKNRHDLSQSDIRNILLDSGPNDDIGMDLLFLEQGGPAANAWLRYYTAERTTGGNDLLIKNQRMACALRAKQYLTDAVNQKILLNFTLTKDPTEVDRAPYMKFDVVGGGALIRGAGFWDSLFHYSSPIQDLFQQTGIGSKWDIGNSYTEQIIDHMIGERWLLVSAVKNKLTALTGGPGIGSPAATNWPLAAVRITGNPGDPPIPWPSSIPLSLEFDSPTEGFVLFVSDAAKQSLAEDGFTVVTASGRDRRQVADTNPTFLLQTTYNGATRFKLYQSTFGYGSDTAAKAYGAMANALLTDIFFLDQMHGTGVEAKWWKDLRANSIVGYGAFVAGDFLFSVKDMASMATGRNIITDEILTPSEWCLSAATVAASFTPGSVVLRNGKTVLLKGGAPVFKGALRNVAILSGQHKLVDQQFIDALTELSKTSDGSITLVGEQNYQLSRNLAANAGLEKITKGSLTPTMRVLADSLTNITHYEDILGLSRGSVPVLTDQVHIAGATTSEVTGNGWGVSTKMRSMTTLFNGVDGTGARNEAKAFATSRELSVASVVTDAEIATTRAFGLSGVAACEASLKFGCFPAGTKVVMADGTSRAIDQVASGDLVQSRDQYQPHAPVVSRRVLAVTVHATTALRSITLYRAGHNRSCVASGGMGGDPRAHAERGEEPPGRACSLTLTTTDEHPFWVEGKGWTAAELLRVGDSVAGSADVGIVTDNHPVVLPGAIPVYNLDIDEGHTFFVLAEGDGGQLPIWVHNVCDEIRQLFNFLHGVQYKLVKASQELVSKEGFNLPLGTWGSSAIPGDSNLLAKELATVPTTVNGIRRQAHHLIPSAVVENHEIFKGFRLPDGKDMPPLPLKTNDKWNGEWVPEEPLEAAKLNMPYHSGFHRSYNLAISDFCDTIQKKMVDEYMKNKDILAALRVRDQELYNMVERARRVILGTGGEYSVDPIQFYKLGLSTEELEIKWLNALTTGTRR